MKRRLESVLVYDAKRAAGHVEIRTEDGFVSDFGPRRLHGDRC